MDLRAIEPDTAMRPNPPRHKSLKDRNESKLNSLRI